MLRHLLIILCLCINAANAHSQILEDKTKAVILAYQRIGEDSVPESNLRTGQFEEHIEEILNAGYNVIALDDLLIALESKTPLPDKTIAITFEGGFRSAYDNAMPVLLDNDLPFAVFFSTGLTDRDTTIDWKELRTLSKNKNVTLGILPASYSHITALPLAEQKRAINKARAEFAEHIGEETQFFSYPFGEISNTLIDILKEQNIQAAFGLQSGPAHAGSNLLTLPRFTMTESYGDAERFRMITQALPMPVTDIEPQDMLLRSNTPALGFTLPETLIDQADKLSCFISGQEQKPTLEHIGSRIEIRPHEPLENDRTRINCTLPGPKDEDDTPRWRWFGMLLHQTNFVENNQAKTNQQDEPQ